MPTRRSEAKSTTASRTKTSAATATRRTRGTSAATAAVETPTRSTRRATTETEPKPTRRRVAAAVAAGGGESPSPHEEKFAGTDPLEAIAADLGVAGTVGEDDETVDPEDLLADTDDDDVDVDVEAAGDADLDADAEEDEESADAAAPPTVSVRGSHRTRPREDEAETLALWKAYKAGPTEQLRNRLIERYLHIVNFSAERMHARLPGEVDVDDLKQAGLFGLMDSIDTFDLERGVKFETFCTQRVRGAIFDELRSMDWVPRLVRARTSKVDRARKQLEAELGRKPTDDELCRQLGVDQNEFKKIIKDSSPVSTVSLDRKWFETDSSKDVREIDVIKDSKQESPLLQLQRGDLKRLITKGLSRAERLIVVLYYYEGMTMKEIGTTLDLSESRVSQMHSSILDRLKAQMQHRDKEF